MKSQITFILTSLALSASAQEQPTRTTVDQGRVSVFSDSGKSPQMSNFKAYLSYEAKEGAELRFSSGQVIALPKGTHTLSVTYENPQGADFSIKALLDDLPQKILSPDSKVPQKSIQPELDKDFTIWTKFQTTEGGTVFAHCAPRGLWSNGAKALLVRGQRLVYDIGWLGAIEDGRGVNDGKEKTVLLRSRQKRAELYLDGKLVGSRKDFWRADPAGHVFKIAKGADDFATPLKSGKVRDLKYWASALPDLVFTDIVSGKLPVAEFPPSDYSMGSGKTVNGIAGKGFAGTAVTLEISNPEQIKFKEAWVQDLGKADHVKEIASLDHFSQERGKKLYESLCITCHGNAQKEGSLPTALKFHSGEFKNGSDPWSMFQTLDKGFGQMIPQPQYSIKDKYALIHYIRESLIKKNNPKQYFEVTQAYLALLPPKLSSFKETVIALPASGSKPYQKMDFRPTLFGD